MLYTTKYPLALRLKVVQDYRNNEGGYKKLAKKYGLSRDLVRFWVLDRHRKIPIKDTAMVISDNKNEDREKYEKSEDLDFLQMQISYYRNLSEILESECTDVKKKSK